MTRALVEASSAGMPAAPDMLDVAGLLLGAGRGQPPASKITLIEAAIILLDRARADLAPAPQEKLGRAPYQRHVERKPFQAPTGRKKRNAVADSSPRRKANAGSIGASKAGRGGDRMLAVATAPVLKPAPKADGGGQARAPEASNGVTVTFERGEESLVYGDHALKLTAKQARLIACLAKALPNPVGREFIAKKMWLGERIPDAADTIISMHMRDLIPALPGIGLQLKTVHGVGVALQKAGE